MKKIKECIAEKWMHYLAIILISISVVCVLLDIVHIFNITYFYSPYILSVPVLLAVVLKLLCTQRESQKEVNGLYYALVLASVEYLMLVLTDYQHNYECSRAHGKTKTVITAKATGNIIFDFEQDGYDIDVLRQQSGFTSLTGRQQEKCEECYRELTPYRNTSVLATGQNKLEYIIL